MKRKMKKSWAFNVILGILVLFMVGCKEEELVFPRQTEQEPIVTETRPTARPTNLTYVSAYNQNVEIHWPALSDRVVKAKVRYTDGGQDRTVDVSKFDVPLVIHLSELKNYDFSLQYFTADGTGSKVTRTALTPRAYEADYKIENVSVHPVPGGVTFIFPNTSTRELPGTLSYTVGGKSFEVSLKGNIKDTVTISNLTDETKKINFSLRLQDDEWNRAPATQVEMAPGLITYKLMLPTVFSYMSGSDAVLVWDNTTKDPVTVRVQYELNGVKKTAKVEGNTDVKGKLTFDVQGKGTTFTYTFETEGLTSPEHKLQVNPLAPLNKLSWTAEVSSTETNEGAANGKAQSLIDGDINTYWHSTWSSTNNPVYPHWFIIDLSKTEILGSIGMIRRHNNTTGGFKTFNVEISLDKVNWSMIAEGLTFNSADSPAAWQDYSLTPVKARYIRITMTVPMNSATSTHLAEFRTHAY
ncbi:discoidin domain-containing protein [Sphingobacterium thalpophilum]|uniref:discoidin domain-containing protein n=1 Tax=Sphingobacterium thalpophilum TaxID=259 RepID=UPI0024A70F58|nr:discoidin domain-containing protein [Sphingobacterium thalpophilum]